MVLLIIGMVAFAGGVYLAMENASVSRRQIQTNMKRAGSYAVIDVEGEEFTKSAKERLIDPMMARFSGVAMRMSPASKRIDLQRKLRNAGTQMKPQTMLWDPLESTCRHASLSIL